VIDNFQYIKKALEQTHAKGKPHGIVIWLGMLAGLSMGIGTALSYQS